MVPLAALFHMTGTRAMQRKGPKSRFSRKGLKRQGHFQAFFGPFPGKIVAKKRFELILAKTLVPQTRILPLVGTSFQKIKQISPAARPEKRKNALSAIAAQALKARIQGFRGGAPRRGGSVRRDKAEQMGQLAGTYAERLVAGARGRRPLSKRFFYGTLSVWLQLLTIRKSFTLWIACRVLTAQKLS